MSKSALRSGTSQNGVTYIACGPQDSRLALVCVHGWACQATDYSYVFNKLLKQDLDFQALAVDLPGHGNSSTAKYPVASMSAFAEAIVALVNELEIPEVVLVGHSMGVRVVLEAWNQSLTAAAGRPNVKALVFLDGSHYKFRKSLFAFDSADPRSNNLTQEEKAAKMTETFTQMFSARTPSEFQASTLAHVKNINVDYNRAMRGSHIAYDYDRMDDVLEELGKSGTPLLNLQSTNVDGENQRVPLTSGELSRWMQFLWDKVPQVKQVVVEDSGHFPQVDQPEVVARRIREFVGGLGGDGARM